ncbi:MAG: hypothetical protein WA786_02940 [Acidimicrobiales bacterium]
MSGSSTCDLCEAAVITTRYLENELCWIGDCEICLVPMVVWRQHDPSPPDELKELMRQSLSTVADGVFGAGDWKYDDHMRNIPDHYHAHARPPGFVRFLAR